MFVTLLPRGAVGLSPMRAGAVRAISSVVVEFVTTTTLQAKATVLIGGENPSLMPDVEKPEGPA
jgi:hypothetical protein